MQIRQLLIRLTAIAGLVAAGGGYFLAWQNNDFFAGTVWLVVGIALMASAAIYSMALDDPEARDQALNTHRQRATAAGPPLDLRDREAVEHPSHAGV